MELDLTDRSEIWILKPPREQYFQDSCQITAQRDDFEMLRDLAKKRFPLIKVKDLNLSDPEKQLMELDRWC